MMLYHIENLVKSRSGEKGYKLLIRNLRIAPGERIAITGPSGCGKSTVLDLLGLALRPDSASVFNFDPYGGAAGKTARPDAGIQIMRLWQDGRLDELADLRLRHMGYVLQSGELLPYLTVGQNMELTARLGGMDAEEAAMRARLLAEELGISDLLSASPNTISFGERQRAAIVRALASQPQVILADEPTASLDPLHAEKVMESFMDAIEENGATLILVTHNMPWARTGRLRELPFSLRADGDGLTAILDDTETAD